MYLVGNGDRDTVCNLDLNDLPESGTNEKGVKWSEVRDAFASLCGLDEPDADGGFVNMTVPELESWADHECADKRSLDPSQVRERMEIVLSTHPRNWESEGDFRNEDPDSMGELEMAQKASSFNARAFGSWENQDDKFEQIDGVRCPTPWGIAALNWAQDPEMTYTEFY